MRTLKTTLIALTLFASLSRAQENKIKTTLVSYAPGPLPAGFTAFFQSGGEILPFNAGAAGLGDPIRYEGPRRFILRESKEAFAAPPEEAKPPLAFVDLPENCNNVLILAADIGGGKIRLIPYDVATNKLKPGEYKIFNFSHSVVQMVLDKQQVVLSPAQDKIMSDPGWIAQPKAFPLKIATVKDQKATLVNETMWEHWPNKRQVMFMFDGRRKGEPIGFMCFNVEAPLKPRENKPQ